MTMDRDEEGNVLVNGIKLRMRDIVGTNGVIHVIDDVLVPESARTAMDALKSRRMNTMMELLDSAKLTESFLKELKTDSQKLKEFLMYHVTTPRKCKCELENNLMLQTEIEDKKIRVNTYGASVLFGDRFKVSTAQCARIVNLDDEVCAGIIHTVDKVLIPPAGYILKVITNGGKYSKFVELLKFSELEEELETKAGKTLLVPTDSAFDKIDKDTASRLKEDKEFAAQVVRKHLLNEVLCCFGIQRNNLFFNNSRKRSSSGDLVAVRRSNSRHLYADKSEISKCDMMASNGVVHQIESLLHASAGTHTAQERMDTFTNIFNFNPFTIF